MSVYNGLKSRVLTHYTAIREIEQGAIPFPRTAIIYPTYGCNLDCLGCEYSGANEAGFRRLPPERLFGLLEELLEIGVEGIEFCGGGEPTLFPGLGEIVAQFDPAKLRFGLLTNGVVFSPALWKIFGSHFDYVRISVDAGNKETYSRTRPSKSGSPWDRVMANIGRLTDVRDADDGCRLKVSYKMLVSKQNYREVAEAAENASGLGCDSFQVKALRVSSEELNQAQVQSVEEDLAKIRIRSSRLAIIGSVRKVVMRRQCILSPLFTTIDPLGEVYLCCYYLHRKERHSIGNILHQPFRAVWGAQKHRDAIAAIRPAECNNLDCRFVAYHDVWDAANENDGGQFEFI